MINGEKTEDETWEMSKQTFKTKFYMGITSFYLILSITNGTLNI